MLIKFKNLNKYNYNSLVRGKEKSENVQLLEEAQDFVEMFRKILLKRL